MDMLIRLMIGSEAALVLVEELKPDSGETTISPGHRDAPEEAPDRLGDYRILREVGRGGMGVVYEAEQESLGRQVALKVLASWAGGSENQIRRFHREARSAAQLHHTNIVPVYGVGEHGGAPLLHDAAHPRGWPPPDPRRDPTARGRCPGRALLGGRLARRVERRDDRPRGGPLDARRSVLGS
jgi:hypothetical protein